MPPSAGWSAEPRLHPTHPATGQLNAVILLRAGCFPETPTRRAGHLRTRHGRPLSRSHPEASRPDARPPAPGTGHFFQDTACSPRSPSPALCSAPPPSPPLPNGHPFESQDRAPSAWQEAGVRGGRQDPFPHAAAVLCQVRGEKSSPEIRDEPQEDPRATPPGRVPAGMIPILSGLGTSAARGWSWSTPASLCVLPTRPCRTSLNMPSPPTQTTLREEHRRQALSTRPAPPAPSCAGLRAATQAAAVPVPRRPAQSPPASAHSPLQRQTSSDPPCLRPSPAGRGS